MNQDFSGKLALVTGGTRGIGLGIVKSLLENGARVALVGSNPEKSAGIASELAGEEQVRGYACDVSEADAVEELVNRVREEMGEIDFLVNNAGITLDGIFIRMKQNDWQRVLDVNLGGTYNFCRSVARAMMKRREGRIVNISSVVGQTGNAGQANYAASKAGQLGLTKSLARELGPRGITVNAVTPGYIETDMTEDLPEAVREEMVAGIPLKKAGSPEDVAGAVLFLLSPSASYISGQVLGVNGGMTMVG
jgi:3-oxoacyl-[acyl-carrier protein] reductase